MAETIKRRDVLIEIDIEVIIPEQIDPPKRLFCYPLPNAYL